MQRESLFIRQKVLTYINFKEFDTTSVINGIDSNKGDGLIFILDASMGTSLTESILSTADKLITGGEKAFYFTAHR